MEYIAVFALLFIFILLYFKLAEKYNIIDKPNQRSSHTEVTLRGGGIIFPLAFLLFILNLFWSNTQFALSEYWLFGIGLISISFISFLDDITTLSSKVRILVHFFVVTLLLFFLPAYQFLPWWAIIIAYILIIGILNAYNFMDGINGISGIYTLVLLSTLLWVNKNEIMFSPSQQFITYPILATLVFLFFNFRKKAKCFMGDVGSMAIAYWAIALIGLLIYSTQNFKWIMLISVYGIDTISTLVERLFRKENIFQPHRRHLYQLLSNELKMDHRWVSVMYGSIQFILNVLLLQENIGIIYQIIIHFALGILYIFVKARILNSITQNH